MTGGNLVGYLALVGVILSAGLLLAARRPERTAITLVFAAVLFLPVGAGIKLPFMRLLDRDTLPYLCLLVAYALRRPAWVLRGDRGGRFLHLLLLVCVVSGLVTFRLNPDPVKLALYRPEMVAPGLTLQDALAFVRGDLFEIVVPFLLGRLLVRTREDGLHLLKAFAVGGLLLVLPILLELRLSPQLHNWIYGQPARAGNFLQSVRGGGFRPVVFFPHGLALGLFMAQALVSAVVLSRQRLALFGLSFRWWAVLLGVILVACKSFAAILYALALVPVVALVRPRRQALVAAGLGLAFLLYPVARSYDLFPTERVLAGAAAASAERAHSLASRFLSEELLLEKVRPRLYFGWGGYCRPCVYNAWGQAEALFDGFWITILSHRGAIYLAAISLLLVLPLLAMRRRLRRIPDGRDRLLLTGLGAIAAVGVVDLIPNGLFTTYPYFLAGALLSLARVLADQPAPAPRPAEEAPEAEVGEGAG